MHPLDVDTGQGFGHALQQIPLIGAVVAAAAARGNSQRVEFWHLIVAVLGLAVVLGSTFGSMIYYEARQQATIEEKVQSLMRDNLNEDATIAYIRRRQEINEERLNKLETASALSIEFENRMVREHADIYQAIRNHK